MCLVLVTTGQWPWKANAYIPGTSTQNTSLIFENSKCLLTLEVAKPGTWVMIMANGKLVDLIYHSTVHCLLNGEYDRIWLNVIYGVIAGRVLSD